MNQGDDFFKRIFYPGSMEELARTVSQEIINRTGAEEATLYICDEELCILRDAYGKSPVPLEDWPCSCAVFSEPVIINDRGKSKEKKSRNNLIAVPLFEHGRVMGALEARRIPGDLEDDKVAAIRELGDRIIPALVLIRAVENHRNYAQHMEELIIRLADSTEGQGHVLRVARIANSLATNLDLPPAEKEKIWTAAIYHDVGYVFSSGAWEGERFHPHRGADFLSGISILRGAATIVRNHHERYDGTGYPLGAGGDDLPISVWILALAEHIEGFMSENRDAPVRDVIIAFYTRHAESHHPVAVEALTALIEDGSLLTIF